jgi:hypothetical protein
MAVQVAPRKFAVDGCHQPAETGTLLEDDRAELIEGLRFRCLLLAARTPEWFVCKAPSVRALGQSPRRTWRCHNRGRISMPLPIPGSQSMSFYR